MINLKRIALFIMATLSVFISTTALAHHPAHRPGELLIRFKSSAQSTGLYRSESRFGLRAIRTMNKGRIHQLALPADMSVEDALALYHDDPDVDFVEPNYLLNPQALPDDPYFDKQWGLHNTGQIIGNLTGSPGADINLLTAWELTAENLQTVVAVVDTGCNLLHPDLSESIWINDAEIPGNGIDDDNNGFVDDIHGWDFADDDNTPQDATGHGTHVAGIIAARSNNATGVSGIGRRVDIMPLRFMNTFDSGTVSDAIAAIEYALAKGVRIINCSWGSTGYSSALHSVMAEADALFVCAAGNSGTNNDTAGFFPANYALSNLISVAATDQLDNLAWFSNFGTKSVHVAAPGSRIYNLGLNRQYLMSENFENGFPTGWHTDGTQNQWGIVENALNGTSSALAVSTSGVYADSTNSWAVLPDLDLSDATVGKLSFLLAGNSEPFRDYLYIEASTDMTYWFNLPVKVNGTISQNGISGAYPQWTNAVIDLAPLDGIFPLYVRFRFRSNADTADSGFYIDNISLTAASSEEAYQYMSGTSMAAAFVSGIAAMAYGNADLNPATLAAAIKQGVDFSDALSGKISTGGRVNAYNSLVLSSDPSFVSNDLSTAPAISGDGSGGGDGGGCFIGQLADGIMRYKVLYEN